MKKAGEKKKPTESKRDASLKKDVKTSQVKIMLKRSLIGSTKQQKSAVYSLGLKKIGQSVEVNLNPVIEGQINKVKHLISLEGNKVEGK